MLHLTQSTAGHFECGIFSESDTEKIRRALKDTKLQTTKKNPNN